MKIQILHVLQHLASTKVSPDVLTIGVKGIEGGANAQKLFKNPLA